METKQLNLGQKIAYGLGDFGGNFLANFIGGFIMLYLTNYIGLNAGIIGMLIFAGRIFDGVTDIAFGTLIDRTHTKYGKARPWMLVSALLCTVGIAAIYAVPDLGETTQYIYFFIIYILTNAFFYTANNISYSTLSALATRNPKERVHLGMARQIFATMAILTIYSATIPLVTFFGGDTNAWKMVALIYAAIFLATNLICVFALKELPEDMQEQSAENPAPARHISFVKTIRTLITSREFLSVLGVYLSFYLFTGVVGAVNVYYTMYVLGNASYMGLLSMAQNLPMVASMFVMPLALNKWGVHKTVMRSLVMAVIGTVLFCMAAFAENLIFLMIALGAFCFFAGPMMGALTGTVGEIGTYIHLQQGIHIEGSLFSCSSIGIKVGSGLGTAIAGWALALSGFDGMAEVQTASALFTIKLMYGGIPVICFVLCLLCFNGLDIQTKIARLREKKGEA